MSYRLAGIDVHKKVLAVVVSDVEIEGEYQFERRWFGSNPEQVRSLARDNWREKMQNVGRDSSAGRLVSAAVLGFAGYWFSARTRASSAANQVAS